jgi:hypothetical protein
MPIILATEDAEIRRIMVEISPGQIVQETMSQKYCVHMYVNGKMIPVETIPEMEVANKGE